MNRPRQGYQLILVFDAVPSSSNQRHQNGLAWLIHTVIGPYQILSWTNLSVPHPSPAAL